MANPSRVLSRVKSIRAFGEGVYETVFEVPARHTRYLPGQFLHLTLEEFDPTSGFWPESRVFSIASAPRQDHVTIVYSVKGAYTKRMERELAVGKEVWLKFPYGSFIIDEVTDGGPIALIAGGTGVSPYLPFLQGERTGSSSVHLFYGVRKPEHILFRDVLASLAGQEWFRPHVSIEEGEDPLLSFHRGRLSIDHVFETLGASANQGRYYLSGPPAMIQKFKSDLINRGIEAARIYIDEWE
jgi:NAD(P)H-flavin reductase